MISLFFWLPLAVLVLLYAVIAMYVTLEQCGNITLCFKRLLLLGCHAEFVFVTYLKLPGGLA